jgi:hypothetical protein
MKALVAFEIEVCEIEPCFQTKPGQGCKSYHTIKEKLTHQCGDAKLIANEREKRTEELFPGESM